MKTEKPKRAGNLTGTGSACSERDDQPGKRGSGGIGRRQRAGGEMSREWGGCVDRSGNEKPGTVYGAMGQGDSKDKKSGLQKGGDGRRLGERRAGEKGSDRHQERETTSRPKGWWQQKKKKKKRLMERGYKDS